MSRLAGLSDRSGHAHLIETFGVTLGEWRILGVIAADAPITMADLGKRMLLDKGQLSRTVARLSARGWVQSARAPANKRTVVLRLTGEGQREHRRILAFAQERNRMMLAAFTAAERRCLFQLLDRLYAFAEAEFVGLASGSAREAERAAVAEVNRGSKR